MSKLLIAVLAIMVIATAGYCANEEQRPREFGGIVAGIATKRAVVTAVDPDTRTVTLKDDEGQEASVVCGPEVRNFAQIRKGDKVKVDYTERAKIIVSDISTVPQRRDEVLVARAPLGKKPGGIIVASTQVLATVESVNSDKRTVRVKGPVRTLNIEVEEGAPYFEQLKAGDTVYLEVTATTAISVSK